MPLPVRPRFDAIGTSPPGSLGYRSYGQPQTLTAPNGRGNWGWLNANMPTGATLLPAQSQAVSGTVIAKSGRARHVTIVPPNLIEALGSGARPKIRIPRWGTWPGGVLAGLPQRRATSVPKQAVGWANVGSSHLVNQTQLSQYMLHRPALRLGPTPKLGPGTSMPNGTAWGTGLPPRTKGISRAQGFVAPGYAEQQYQDVHQFDYMPDNDETRDLGLIPGAFTRLPQTIEYGTDGRSIVGTWQPHDFLLGSVFFKQGRSATNWQDMSFGPDVRWLQPQQQVARYNLYTDIQLARQVGPNSYFLQYQTDPSVASQMGGTTGMGAPLGYR